MFCSWWAHSDSSNLAKRPISDKILRDRTFEIPINLKYDSYLRGLASMAYTIFDKKHDQELEQ